MIFITGSLSLSQSSKLLNFKNNHTHQWIKDKDKEGIHFQFKNTVLVFSECYTIYFMNNSKFVIKFVISLDATWVYGIIFFYYVFMIDLTLNIVW